MCDGLQLCRHPPLHALYEQQLWDNAVICLHPLYAASVGTAFTLHAALSSHALLVFWATVSVASWCIASHCTFKFLPVNDGQITSML